MSRLAQCRFSFSVPLSGGVSDPSAQAALVEGLLNSDLLPDREPDRVVLEDHRVVPAPAPAPSVLIARSRRSLSWNWDKQDSAYVIRKRRVMKAGGLRAIDSAEDLLAEVAALPWAWMASTALDPTAWGFAGAKVEYLDAPFFGDSHFGHGWVCGFQGEGHRQLVSRRWLDHGPWRVLRGLNDTTLVEFHAVDVDPMTALEQARPGHQQMGISPEGGFIPSRMTQWQYPELRNVYDPGRRELTVVVMGRDVPPGEMLEACAIRLHQPLEVPVDNVAYVFMEPDRARAHLHALWLRELGCRALVDGREVDLMAGYQPPAPVRPEWVG